MFRCKDTTSYQQLQPEDRMTIASMRQQGSSVRAMARMLGRSPGTISRELARNSRPMLGYASAHRAGAEPGATREATPGRPSLTPTA